MARITISESFEIGNTRTGDYARWSKSAELVGDDADDVLRLFKKTSSKLVLPCSRLDTEIKSRLLANQSNYMHLLDR